MYLLFSKTSHKQGSSNSIPLFMFGQSNTLCFDVCCIRPVSGQEPIFKDDIQQAIVVGIVICRIYVEAMTF